MRNKNIRSLPQRILRFVDRLAFSALCAAAILIPLRKSPKIVWIAALVGAAALLLVLALDRRAARRETERLRQETARAIRLEKILLSSDEALKAALGVPSLRVLRGRDPSAAEIAEALRDRPACLVMLSDTEKAAPLICAYAPGTRLIDADALLAATDAPCTEEEVTERLAALRAKRQKPRRPTLRLSGNAPKFLLLGILLLVLSLVWRHKIYYRLLSVLCFGTSVISGGFGFQKACRNFGIFLDKLDK